MWSVREQVAKPLQVVRPAVIVTRTFKARPERVFAAFEDPAEMALWMRQPGSKTEVQALDVREGGGGGVRAAKHHGRRTRGEGEVAIVLE